MSGPGKLCRVVLLTSWHSCIHFTSLLISIQSATRYTITDFLTHGVALARGSSALKEKYVIGIMRIESTAHRQAMCSLLGYEISRPHRLKKINAKHSPRRDPNQSDNMKALKTNRFFHDNGKQVEKRKDVTNRKNAPLNKTPFLS